MSEFSVIGFDPMLIITANSKKLTVADIDGTKDTYEINEPMQQIRELIPRVYDERFRYLGGAVGYASYDAIRYWEKIPMKNERSVYPEMEFGLYTDGILFNHKENEVHYFYLDKPRIKDLDLEHV